MTSSTVKLLTTVLMPELDCVSFGPDIYNIHTTEEKLSISSTQRMWEYLLAILKTK
jgi:dipeptidase D